jgi:hypothetical protein
MVIITEKKLNEGVDLRAIQKAILTKIASSAVSAGADKKQQSPPEKIFVGVALGALMGVAEWLNPMQFHCPMWDNPQKEQDALRLRKDVENVYRKNILSAIADLEKIYVTKYGNL